MPPDARTVVAAHLAGGAPPRWTVPPDLLASAAVETRDRWAGGWHALALDDAAAANGGLGPDAMRQLVRAAARHLLDVPLEGVGIDLGAGLGVLAATVATDPRVEGVLAVEVCPAFVDEVIPATAAAVLGDDARKVVPVHGTFDRLEVADGTVDFAIEIDSLHHADDLDAVLAETARVLRPGAPLVAFDRVQPDDMPDWLRERMLDHVYTPEFLASAGHPPDLVLTRRENGEHEIRRREWAAAFARAGLRLERVVELVPRIDARLAAKATLSWLPRPLRRRLVALPAPRGFAPAWALTRVARSREAVGPVVFAPKRTTGMLAVRT